MNIKEYACIKIIELIPRIDAVSVHRVDSILTELIDSGHTNIICDFSQNEYLSSAGLRSFLSALKRTKRANSKLVLCALRPGVHEIFAMAGFTQLFTILESQKAAIDYLMDLEMLATQKEIATHNYSVKPSPIRHLDEKI